MLDKPAKPRFYCNTCRRFVSKEDMKKYEEAPVTLFAPGIRMSPDPVHKSHDMIQVVLPPELDCLSNDSLNILLRTLVHIQSCKKRIFFEKQETKIA